MIVFYSTNPHQLLASLRAAVSRRQVETWSCIGEDFTHTPIQWARKAYLRPTILGNELRFAIIRPNNANISTEVYAVYHGRFVEMMLAHFDKQFTNSGITAMPTAVDMVAA